ncbi:uncharacterized protein [Pagrus major]|uniref:uncharacterized protein n=1 Tax=Pagrus major TaxID=143350 RepID=UPI003CC8A47B
MASLVFLLFLLYEAASETVVIQVVPVKPGQDATLPCDAGDASIRAVEWTRSEPKPSKFILFWSDGHTDTPYEGRVQLVDGEMKNGDVSLILKNVSREDVGTYECRVVTAGSRRNKRALRTEPISRVRLQVTGDQNGDIKDGDNNNRDNEEGNSTPLHVGLGAAADTQVKVKPGDDATLQCRAHRDDSIKSLAWSKTDLESDYYVFYFRENRSQENYQLPSFRGRVELLDPQMKEGDATVVLKKVTANDSGTYECLVFMSSGGHRRKRAAPFRHIVHLKVEDSGPKAGESEEGGSE